VGRDAVATDHASAKKGVLAFPNPVDEVSARLATTSGRPDSAAPSYSDIRMSARNAVVLLSGGLDSTTVLAIAQAEGFTASALSFDYGQRHATELDAARAIAAAASVEHVVARIDLRVFGGSALTADIAVPKGRSPAEMGDGIPVTYVPARNTIFLSFALAWAETLGASDIFVGVNALDYSGYPDCRPEYIEAFERMANLATKAGVEGTQRLRIHAPLMELTKEGIIRRGLDLGVDYAATQSCYDPDGEGRACGGCDACALRLRGFAAVGVPDPARYAPVAEVAS
jgi:7-cyano-7-deazaguanine synthase